LRNSAGPSAPGQLLRSLALGAQQAATGLDDLLLEEAGASQVAEGGKSPGEEHVSSGRLLRIS